MNSRLSSFATLLGLCVAGLLLAGMPGEIHGSASSSPQSYKTTWDQVNWIELLQIKRLTQHYFDCLMDVGKCDPHMKDLKRFLPEALATGCASCTEKQVQLATTVIRHLREFEPEKFTLLSQKYDPEGIYTRKYRDFYYTIEV